MAGPHPPTPSPDFAGEGECANERSRCGSQRSGTAARVVSAATGVACLLLIASACAGDGGEKAALNLPPWSEIEATLSPSFEPASANPCQSGKRECLDIVLAEMQRRAKPLANSCDHDALFATMYMRMTEKIRDASDRGRFADPAATAHFTAWFARYYFHAYDDWHSGRKEAVPEAWRIAFQAADDRSVRGLGNLLLGMNAHISRDLAYVVADVLRAPEDTVDPDYALVNSLLGELSDPVVKEMAKRFDPTLELATVPIALRGADSIAMVFTNWRTDSWLSGNALLRAGESARPATVAKIEAASVDRANAILPEVRYLPIVESAKPRDAFCKAKS